jgi:hypothetical protein
MPLQQFNEWSVSNLRTELSRHMGHAFFGSTLCQWPTIYEQLTPLAIGELTGTSVLTIELPGENLDVFLALGL